LAFVLATFGCAELDQQQTPSTGSPSDTQSVPVGTITKYGSVTPFDEGARDSTFLVFREDLLRIVSQRDTTRLMSIVAPDVRVSFGPDNGVAAFRDQWHPGDADSRIWAVLDDVLRHGGRFISPDFFVAPYTFFALPDSLDAFEYLVVRDTAVIVRDAADATARPLGRVSFAIVKSTTQPAPDGWTAVEIGDGRTGFIASNQVRSPVDYRVGFERQDGRWVLVFLAAGD
jgi:hypothetical protein